MQVWTLDFTPMPLMRAPSSRGNCHSRLRSGDCESARFPKLLCGPTPSSFLTTEYFLFRCALYSFVSRVVIAFPFSTLIHGFGVGVVGVTSSYTVILEWSLNKRTSRLIFTKLYKRGLWAEPLLPFVWLSLKGSPFIVLEFGTLLNFLWIRYIFILNAK